MIVKNYDTALSYRPKTLTLSNKSQKFHFSVTFSLITFFSDILKLFQWIRNDWIQTSMKRLFCKCVLELHFATIKGLGEPRCWNRCTLMCSTLLCPNKPLSKFIVIPCWGKESNMFFSYRGCVHRQLRLPHLKGQYRVVLDPSFLDHSKVKRKHYR